MWNNGKDLVKIPEFVSLGLTGTIERVLFEMSGKSPDKRGGNKMNTTTDIKTEWNKFIELAKENPSEWKALENYISNN